MERSIIVYQVLISLTALFLIVSAEIASYDDNKVYKIKQKSGCPTILCPWNCDRYLDWNGCIYCGKCSKKSTCPKVDCPDLPNVRCAPVIGMDGCITCKCRETGSDCPSLPLCATNCHLVQIPFGCPKCECFKVDCEIGKREEDPCQDGCKRQKNVHGCFDCVCPDDVDVCPEVPCDPSCKHNVDSKTGCATGCICPEKNT